MREPATAATWIRRSFTLTIFLRPRASLHNAVQAGLPSLSSERLVRTTPCILARLVRYEAVSFLPSSCSPQFLGAQLLMQPFEKSSNFFQNTFDLSLSLSCTQNARLHEINFLCEASLRAD